MIPPCVINPKTGKPYSRHKYDNTPYVRQYVVNWYGATVPGSYGITRNCVREGCGFRGREGSY